MSLDEIVAQCPNTEIRMDGRSHIKIRAQDDYDGQIYHVCIPYEVMRDFIKVVERKLAAE